MQLTDLIKNETKFAFVKVGLKLCIYNNNHYLTYQYSDFWKELSATKKHKKIRIRKMQPPYFRKEAKQKQKQIHIDTPKIKTKLNKC